MSVAMPAGDQRTRPVVQLERFAKTFGAVRVLSDIGLQVLPGEMRALIGHNGSGKSTLVKCLSGFYRPDAGSSATVRGTPLDLGDARSADAAGIQFIHQDLGLIPDLSVTDNVALDVGYRRRRSGRIDWRATHQQTRELLEQIGYDIDVRRPVRELAMAEQTGVAIARAVAPRRGHGTCLVVLDEPTANLNTSEADHLFAVLERLLEGGIGALLITHHLEEVMRHADSVTVLRDGKVVAAKPMSAVDSSDDLVALMLGAEAQQDLAIPVPAGSRNPAGSALTVRGLGSRTIRTLDLEVGSGEIVGIAGITGSGREEVAAAVFGGLPRTGEVLVTGRTLPPARPGTSVRRGVSLLPARRREHGIFPGLDVAENLTLARIPAHGRVVLDSGRRREIALQWINQLRIRPGLPAMPIERLSGGNQQKVMLARSLETTPAVLLLDEPTQGVDVSSAGVIHARIRQAAQEGAAVLVASSDNDELVRLCTRVLVMRRGEVAAEVRGAELDRDRIDSLTLKEQP
ncbi:sugar ABC transporter ATP-binding protein [Kribbella sp. NPDC058245]|uniref:sugar ABC transporter ATP-binding protein n=1 Tax=Kribbella sp. NPDC058245 TaxID=3346399 RepID=UPI0036EEFBAF